jgi:hypothetical protein
LRIFGQIFLDRLNSYVTWDFAIWGILLAVFATYFDKIIDRYKRIAPIINITLLVIFILEIFLENKFHAISLAYKYTFLNLQITAFVNEYYWLLLLIIILAITLIKIWQLKIKTDLLQEVKINNPIPTFLLSLTILFFFISPGYQGLTQSKITSNENHNVLNTNGTSYLPLLTDHFMPAYPRSAKEQEISLVFSSGISDEYKLSLLKNYKIDYIFLTIDEQQISFFLDKFPEKFQKILHEQDTYIYKII